LRNEEKNEHEKTKARRNNIVVERLGRSLKYEDLYLKDCRSMEEVKAGLKRYFAFYSGGRYHAPLEYRIPDEVYVSAFKDGQAEAGPLPMCVYLINSWYVRAPRLKKFNHEPQTPRTNNGFYLKSSCFSCGSW
jgi:hypothetical protein